MRSRGSNFRRLSVPLHNCQKTQKVITFSRFLIEHPVFIMYMVYIHLKKKKSGRKKIVQFFLDRIGFVPTISRDRQRGPNYLQNRTIF